jgi:hypothetical protein
LRGALGIGLAILGPAVLGLTACHGDDGGSTAPSSKPVALVGLGRPRCRPPTPIDPAGNEVRATSAPSTQLWGIAMGQQVPPRADAPLKIVWRMTGRGPLRVRVTGPGGAHARLTFGPEPHLSSTYARPGDEWGTGFRFPQPGCWRIHLARTDTAGDVWMRVE